MRTKKCRVCQRKRLVKFFNKNKTKRDGLQFCCTDCNKSRMKNYYAANKVYFKKKARARNIKYLAASHQYILSLLESGCVDCPEKDCRCLEFDHVRGKKYKSISVLLARGYSMRVLRKELAKCVIRCANCHRKRTSDCQLWYKSTIKPIE